MNTLKELQNSWVDTPESHKRIHDLFCQLTDSDPRLKKLRDWIETNIFGFGERSFYHMWKLIVQELPKDFTFLEIGVFRGQTLALIQTLAPEAQIYGITPLDSTDGHWESDYKADIEKLHDLFNLEQPTIFKGLSTNWEIQNQAMNWGFSGYNCIYIDGGHSYDVVKQDVEYYPNLLKVGGYLVIDDCCHKYQIPSGMFPGIETVSKAVDEWTQKQNDFEELFSVVHIRVFKRVK